MRDRENFDRDRERYFDRDRDRERNSDSGHGNRENDRRIQHFDHERDERSQSGPRAGGNQTGSQFEQRGGSIGSNYERHDWGRGGDSGRERGREFTSSAFGGNREPESGRGNQTERNLEHERGFEDWNRSPADRRSFGQYNPDVNRDYRANEQEEWRRGGQQQSERWGERGQTNRGGLQSSYQRGSSGSEGGFSNEESYGNQRDFSHRGGGTGIRDTEHWNREDRGRQWGDYGQGGIPGGYAGGMGSSFGRGEQRESGRFAGKGPKGWHRPDDRIREDICERLTHHPDIDASEVDIQVKECEVTLTGSVDDRHAKRLAEDIAESVSGVKHVHNNLRLQRGGSNREEQGLGKNVQSSTGNDPTNPLGMGQQRSGSQQTPSTPLQSQQGNQPTGGQQSTQGTNPGPNQSQFANSTPYNQSQQNRR